MKRSQSEDVVQHEPNSTRPQTADLDAEPSAVRDAQAFADNYPKIGEGLPEPLDAHVTYIAAALSWYDGSECGPDVHEAWDYIVTSLRDMRADYLRVLGEKNDALFGKAEPRLCGACGEMVTGPCHHLNDPCGLFTAPPILAPLPARAPQAERDEAPEAISPSTSTSEVG